MAVFFIRSALSLMHIYTNTPSNVCLKHTDFNLRVITYSTGARGFGRLCRPVTPAQFCLYILHHIDTVRRGDFLSNLLYKTSIFAKCKINLGYN